METGLDGLYAAGEVVGGVHGANRISGNAISEILVFGAIAGSQAAQRAADRTGGHMDSRHATTERDRLEKLSRGNGTDSKALRTALKNLMWTEAGVLRSEESLLRATEGIDALKDKLGAFAVAASPEAEGEEAPAEAEEASSDEPAEEETIKTE